MVLRLDIVVRVVTKNVQNELKGVSGGFNMAKKAVAGFGAALIGITAIELSRFVNDAVGAFASFDNEVRRAAAVMANDLSPEAGELTRVYGELEAKARELGITTVFTADQAAKALFEMGQAGLSAEEAITGVGDVLNLAQIGAIGMAESARISTDIMAGMGLQAEDLTRVVDVMTIAVTSSNQTISQLGTAFSKVGPMAKLLGFEVEEVATALSALANAGIRGTEGGAALRQMFLRLLNPVNDAVGTLEKLGLAASDITSGMLSLHDILLRLKTAYDEGSISLEELAEIFQARATAGVGAFISSLDDSERGFAALQTNIENSKGAAEDMTNFINESANFSFLQLKATIQDLKIELGAALAPTLIQLINTFRGNTEGVRELLNVLGIGLVGAVRIVINFVNTARKAFDGMMESQGGLINVLNDIRETWMKVFEDLKPALPFFKLLAATVGALVGAFLLGVLAIGKTAVAFGPVIRQISTLIGVISEIIILIGMFVAKMKDLEKQTDKVGKAWNKFVDAIGAGKREVSEEERAAVAEEAREREERQRELGYQAGGSFVVRRTGKLTVHAGEEGVIANTNAGQSIAQFLKGGEGFGGKQVNVYNTFNVANPDPMLMKRATDKYIRDLRRR